MLFASASATIDSDGERVLTAAAATLKAEHATTVSVVGYTDVVAGQKVNDALSQQRADAVAAKLRALLPGVTVSISAKGSVRPDRKQRLGRRPGAEPTRRHQRLLSSAPAPPALFRTRKALPCPQQPSHPASTSEAVSATR